MSADPLAVLGSAGAAHTLSAHITANGGVFAGGSGNVSSALTGLQQARDWCANLPGQVSLPALSGQQLTAGTYSLTGNVVLHSSDVLTLQGDSSDVFIFNIEGQLELEALARVELGDVRPGHVFWNLKDGLLTASTATLSGIVLSGSRIRLEGDTDGQLALLAADSVRLRPRDLASGRLWVASPLALPAFCPRSTCRPRRRPPPWAG